MTVNTTPRDLTSPFISTGTDLWQNRAEVPGYRAVMGQRFSHDECELATAELVKYMRGKTVQYVTGASVLELGAGVGRFTRMLARDAASVVGLDISSKMLERAKANTTDCDTVRYVLADATAIPCGDKSFDCVFEFMVLMHIVDDEKFVAAINELKRVLKEGGTVIVGGVFSQSGSTHLANPQFKKRTIADYETALAPYTLQANHELTSLGEALNVLIFK